MISMCSGRKVAIDASMSIYQFLIAVRQDGSTLTNAEGETTRYDLIAFKYFTDITVLTLLFFLETNALTEPFL